MSKESTPTLLGKLFLFILLGYFAFVIMVKQPSFNILDNVNLLFHEAGHLIFSLFGRFISIAGGTIMQLLIPLGIAIYFLVKKNIFALGVGVFWFGENLVNISYYAADAQTKVLPLIGGGHDWSYLLSKLSLLKNAELVGNVFLYTGEIVIISSLVFMFLYLLLNFIKLQEQAKT